MPGSSSNVIVTSAGRSNDRSALATVRALGMAGHPVVVVASHSGSLAAASRFATRVIAVESLSETAYGHEVRQIASDAGATVIFATSDAALRALFPTTNTLMDKATLGERANAVGLSTPETREVAANDIDESFTPDVFPMIVKPRTKTPGGMAAIRVDTREELRKALRDGGLVQPWIPDTTRALSGIVWGGVLVASVQQRYLRTFPARAGTASAAITEPVNTEWATALTALLVETNGIFQAQFVGSDLIDLNLRPYGSMPLALAAGLNLPDLVCRLSAGETVEPVTGTVGVRYRWTDGDLRTLISDLRSGNRSVADTIKAIAPRQGTAHSITTLSDPRPGLVRLRRGG